MGYKTSWIEENLQHKHNILERIHGVVLDRLWLHNLLVKRCRRLQLATRQLHVVHATVPNNGLFKTRCLSCYHISSDLPKSDVKVQKKVTIKHVSQHNQENFKLQIFSFDEPR